MYLCIRVCVCVCVCVCAFPKCKTPGYDFIGIQWINILVTKFFLKRRLFPGGSDGKVSAYSRETRVQSMGREDLLEKGMASHFSILAPPPQEKGGSKKYLWTSLVVQRLKHLPAMWETWVGKIPWKRKWQPTPVFLHGKSHGQRSLVGYNPWGSKESDMTEWLHFTSL